MIRMCSAVLVSVLLMFGARAEASTMPFSFNGEDYEVTLVTGTFNDLSTLLEDQIWWGNTGTAHSFASAVGNLLGSPPENTGLTFSSWGPLFAVAVNGTQVSNIALDVAGVFGFTIQGPTSTVNGTHTYAVASSETSPVPLPAAAWMLLAALGGLVGVRRFKTT